MSSSSEVRIPRNSERICVWHPGNLPVILALQLVTTQKQAQGLTWLLTIQITVIYCNVPALHTIMLRRAYSSTTSYEGCLAYG